MQKLYIWKNEYKVPKIHCVKLRCTNSAFGKLYTKYLKSTASSEHTKMLHVVNWIQNTQNTLHQAKMQNYKQQSLHNSFVTLMEVINKLNHIILGCSQRDFQSMVTFTLEPKQDNKHLKTSEF